MGRTNEDYLAAAVDLLRTYGPTQQNLGLSAGAMASMAGVSRTAIYRHWETVADANDDVARWAATAWPGWQHRILEQPPTEPFSACLARAWPEGAQDLGVLVRAIVSGWPAESTVVRDTAQWEDDWLDAFESWLGAHVAHRGRRFASGTDGRAAALGLSLLIEGTQFLDRCRTAGKTGGFAAASRAVSLVVCERFLDALTEPELDPAMGADDPTTPATDQPSVPPPPPLQSRSSAAQAIVARVCDHAASATTGDAPFVVVQRLVDMARLSRRLGVSERQAYAMYPTPSSLNGELAEWMIHRDRQLIIETLTSALGRVIEPELTDPRQLYVSAIADLAVAVVHDMPWNMTVYALMSLDPEVAAFMTTIVDGSVQARSDWMLLMMVLGRHFRRDLGLDWCCRQLMNLGMGVKRFTMLHPEINDMQVCCAGRDEPIVGVLAYKLIEAMTHPEAPEHGEPIGPTDAAIDDWPLREELGRWSERSLTYPYSR